MESDQPDIAQEASPHPEFSKQSPFLRKRKRLIIARSKLFKCPQCERTYTTKSHLQRHLSNHDTIRYDCPECKETFYSRDELRSHLSLCAKSHQIEEHSSLPAVKAIRDPLVVSDMHQSLFPPGLPANDLTRTNLTSNPSEVSSLQYHGTSYDKDNLDKSEFDMNTYNTLPRGSPVPHTTTVGESQWKGKLGYFGDSDTTNLSFANDNVDNSGLPAGFGSHECNNLDTIDQLDLLASHAANSTETLSSEESSANAGSSTYRAQTNVAKRPVRTDKLRRGSDRVREAQRSHLNEALREFVTFFGRILIQKTGSNRWMEQRMVQCSNDKKLISKLLENYAAEMMWVYCCSEHSAIAVVRESKSDRRDFSTLMDDTIELIHHYRADIVDYLCCYDITGGLKFTGGLEFTASAVDNLLGVTQQQSILRWYSSFKKSSSNQKGLRNVGDLTHKKVGTAGEKIISNEFDLVKETLISDEAFLRLVSEMRLEVPHDFGSRMDTLSQIVTSEFGMPRGVNTQKLCVSFEVEWDIPGFMRLQYGKLVPIATVVVLTGSSTNAQATTCGEYVRQNWPLFGSKFLSFIDKSLASVSGDHVRVGSGSSSIKYVRDFALT
jgi:predicted RNA-binding Zn-ribbon protein involved in translation (DUF1610 family)